MDLLNRLGLDRVVALSLGAFWVVCSAALAIRVGGAPEKLTWPYLGGAVIALGIGWATAAIMKRRPAGWRRRGTMKEWSGVAAVVGALAAPLLLLYAPSFSVALLAGVLFSPFAFDLMLAAERWSIGRIHHAGRASSDDVNVSLPAAFVARWADAGALHGWRLNDGGGTWSKDKAAPGGVEILDPNADLPPFASVVSVADEHRARWQRFSIRDQPGTIENPGSKDLIRPQQPELWTPAALHRTIVYGASGSGKTVLLSELARRALADGGRVLYIDGKGRTDDALKFASVAAAAGVPADLVRIWNRDPMGLFAGLNPADALTLLETMAEAAAPGEHHPHYANMQTLAFTLVLDIFHREGRTPSLSDIVQFLGSPSLSVQDPAYIQLMTTDKSGASPASVAAGALHAAKSVIGPYEHVNGWSPVGDDNWQLGIVSVPAASKGGAAMVAAVMRRLVLDISAHNAETPLLLIVDEAAFVFAAETACADALILAGQGRSAGVPAIFAFQDLADLDPQVAERFNTNAEMVFVGSTTSAVRYLELGGNKAQHEATRGETAEDKTSLRTQTSYGVPPWVVEQLPTWAWAVYVRPEGRWTGLLVPPLPAPEQVEAAPVFEVEDQFSSAVLIEDDEAEAAVLLSEVDWGFEDEDSKAAAASPAAPDTLASLRLLPSDDVGTKSSQDQLDDLLFGD